MTWGLALIQEAPVCWNMSKHVPCRSGLRCLLTCNFWCNAKVRDFCSEFWDERTYATSFRYVAADRRGGFLVLRHTLEARRLGWCAFIGFFLGQQPPMEEQGMCYDGIFRGGTGPKSHVVIRISPLRVCTCLHHFGRCLESYGAYSFPISVSEWPNWFCVSDGFWRWYVANRGKILSKNGICSVFSWDVVELDEDGIGTMWKYVKGTISGIFGAQMCSGWNVLRPVRPLQASPLGCLGWISLVTHVWHVTSCHKLSCCLRFHFQVVLCCLMWFHSLMLFIQPAALHIWDHLRDILRWGWFFQLI